jgi:hypothetical protein
MNSNSNNSTMWIIGGIILLLIIAAVIGVVVWKFKGKDSDSGGSEGNPPSEEEKPAEEEKKPETTTPATNTGATTAGGGGMAGYKEYPRLSWIHSNQQWKLETEGGNGAPVDGSFFNLTTAMSNKTKEECAKYCSDLNSGWDGNCIGFTYDPINKRCAMYRPYTIDNETNVGWTLSVLKDDKTFKDYPGFRFKSFNPEKIAVPDKDKGSFRAIYPGQVVDSELCKSLCANGNGNCHAVYTQNKVDNTDSDRGGGLRTSTCYHIAIPPAQNNSSYIKV